MLRRLRPHHVIMACLFTILSVLTGSTPAMAHSSWSGSAPYLYNFSVSAACPTSLDYVDLNAASKWTTAPANGYMKLIRQRQMVDDNGKVVVTQSKTTQLKDTNFEGYRADVHWTKWSVQASAYQLGYWTRSVFRLEYKKDDWGGDTLVAVKYWATKWCVQTEN